MTYAKVQDNGIAGSSSATTITCAYTTANTAHALLVAHVSWSATGSVSSLTDTLGNTWIKLVEYDEPTNLQHSALWACLDAKAGANTVTAHFSTSVSYRFLVVSEWPVGPWTLDGTPFSAAVASDTPSIGPITLDDTTVDVLLIAGLTYGYPSSGGGGFTITAGTGYTKGWDTYGAVTYEYKTLATGGAASQTATFTAAGTGGANSAGVALAAFKILTGDGSDGSGIYEWQVRVTGQKSGTQSDWSASGFFLGSAPPPAPTVVHPSADEVINSTAYIVTWTPVSGQQTYRVTVYGDDGAGNVDLTKVFYDTGRVAGTNGGNNFQPVTIPAGNYQLHVYVTVSVGGSDSLPAMVRALAQIPPPGPPTLTATPDSPHGKIVVVITNSTQVGYPAAVSNDIYRSDPNNAEIRVATGVAVNGSWTDYTPASGVRYSYRAVAVGANGAGASS